MKYSFLIFSNITDAIFSLDSCVQPAMWGLKTTFCILESSENEALFEKFTFSNEEDSKSKHLNKHPKSDDFLMTSVNL